MLSRTRQQVIIGIVAAVWLVLALLAGQPLSPTPLRLYSIAGAAVTVCLIVYDRYIWNWKWVRRFTVMPSIAGTWRGQLISSHVRPDGTGVPPIPTVLRIMQTASTLSVTLFTGESSSASKQAQLTRLEDGRWSLSWLYENTPRPTVRHRSERHCGAAELRIGGANGEELSGEYFTDRLTRGELLFTEWSPRRYGSAESALVGTDFTVPSPFVGAKR
jgi:hypothetical protein